MSKEANCMFCGTLSDVSLQENGTYHFVECPICGRYMQQTFPLYYGADMKNEIASYLYFSDKAGNVGKSSDYIFLGPRDAYEKDKKEHKNSHYVSREEIQAFYPKTFAERIDKILLLFAEKSPYFGSEMIFQYDELVSVYFVSKYDNSGKNIDLEEVEIQANYINDYLVENEYIEHYELGGNRITLTAKGWARIDELQKNISNNKNIFVSMAFNDSTKDTREAIRQGIINAGYSAEFIDEIVHNKQIVPEMFRLISESRFLILDISDPNYGAYYEAGYALGLGKEVIICCNQDVFGGNIKINGETPTEEEKKKFGKYLRPHFDIAQKQILVWEDYADLTKKLEEWIKAII